MSDWAGFFALAERLVVQDGDAELRSAVSRAYYAAYSDARRYARNKSVGFAFNDDQHWKVWDWFGGEPGQARQVATLGSGLRKKRNQADYDVYTAIPNLKHEATQAVQRAKKILTILETLRAS